jgi:heme/copper-type cytochrome/quinol oxidase subunit 2
MACASEQARIVGVLQEASMYHYIDGWDWLWMTLMMGLWVVILAAVVYLVVKLSRSDRGGKPSA